MSTQAGKMMALCDDARNPDWVSEIQAARGLSDSTTAFIAAHRPGLVRALWSHFEHTRDRCGCESPAHEKPDCTVGLIEKLLLEQELD